MVHYLFVKLKDLSDRITIVISTNRSKIDFIHYISIIHGVLHRKTTYPINIIIILTHKFTRTLIYRLKCVRLSSSSLLKNLMLTFFTASLVLNTNFTISPVFA